MLRVFASYALLRETLLFVIGDFLFREKRRVAVPPRENFAPLRLRVKPINCIPEYDR